MRLEAFTHRHPGERLEPLGRGCSDGVLRPFCAAFTPRSRGPSRLRDRQRPHRCGSPRCRRATACGCSTRIFDPRRGKRTPWTKMGHVDPTTKASRWPDRRIEQNTARRVKSMSSRSQTGHLRHGPSRSPAAVERRQTRSKNGPRAPMPALASGVTGVQHTKARRPIGECRAAGAAAPAARRAGEGARGAAADHAQPVRRFP